MKVRFNDFAEYVQELKFHTVTGRKPIARITKCYKQTSGQLTIITLVLVVGVFLDGELLVLRKHVGSYLGTWDGQEVVDRADTLVTTFTDELEKIGFDVRAGMYEESENNA